MTCDTCLDGRHIKCHDFDCSCYVCDYKGIYLHDPLAVEAKIKRTRTRTERKQYVRKPDPRKDTIRAKNKTLFGFYSDLEPEVIRELQELQKQNTNISAAARRFGISRDMVRNVYMKGEHRRKKT